jgi:hypothetical protein
VYRFAGCSIPPESLPQHCVDELTSRSVAFERYDGGPITTDEKGIATFECGAKVAYSRNLDGKTLSTATKPHS